MPFERGGIKTLWKLSRDLEAAINCASNAEGARQKGAATSEIPSATDVHNPGRELMEKTQKNLVFQSFSGGFVV